MGKDDWVNKTLSNDCISFLEYEAKDLQLKLEKKDNLDIKRNKIRNELKKIKNNKYKK